MILQELVKYYERMRRDAPDEIPPPGMTTAKIDGLIVIDEEGHFVELEDLRAQVGKNQIGRSLQVPATPTRTSGVRAQPLFDNQSYVLGIVGAKQDETPQQSKKREERACLQLAAFLELATTVRDSCPDDIGFRAVCRFYESGEYKLVTEHQGWQELSAADPTLSFRLNGSTEPVCSSPQLAEAFQQVSEKQGTSVCLVTGEFRERARLHPAIQLPGGQTSGCVLVSNNAQSSKSHGWMEGRNAPTSEYAAQAYGQALHYLLERGHNIGGGCKVVYWAADSVPLEHSLEALFFQDQADVDGTAIRALYRHLEESRDGTTDFFLLGLSPAAARVAVRFFIRSTVAELSRTVRSFWKDLEIARGSHDPERPTIYQLLRSMAPLEDVKRLSPRLGPELTMAALQGRALPHSILGGVIQRCRSEQNRSAVTYCRAALLKAWLNRYKRSQSDAQWEDIHVSLDPHNTNPGYRLGRLFALLEYTQKQAVNAETLNSYFSSASGTPVAVFPRLIRLSRHHLAKLQKDKPGMAIHLERQIQEVVEPLAEFPGCLDLQRQGHFALGYYHQKQNLYTKRDTTEGEES